jgi:cytochrome c oxidase subunit 4
MADHDPHSASPGHGDSHGGDSQGSDPHDHDAGHAHGGSIKTYIAVFIALCVLTTASFMTWTPLWQSFVSDNKHVAWVFMMAISCTKAMLVIMFFMHLKYEANWKYVLTFPAAFMSVFLALMLVPDIGMRFWHYSRDRLFYSAIPTAKGAHPSPAQHPKQGEHTVPAAAPSGAETPHQGKEH